MSYLDPIDYTAPGFGELYDELPLWSAPFGLLLLDHVPLKPGLTFLDIGAGTGFLTIELAERCGPTTRVIAVDPWRAGMAQLQRKITRRALQNITLLEQDASTIDLPDSSVDVVVSNLGINNFDDPAAVLRTCARVTRPGAPLLLTTNLAGHMAELYAAYREVLIDLGHEDRLPALDAHIHHRGTVDSVTALLREAGFDEVEVIQRPFQMRFASGSTLLRHHFIRLGFVQGWKAIARPDSVQETFDHLEHKLDTIAHQHGELALTVPMALFVAHRQTATHTRPQAPAPLPPET